jgi:hypothetical protein
MYPDAKRVGISDVRRAEREGPVHQRTGIGEGGHQPAELLGNLFDRDSADHGVMVTFWLRRVSNSRTEPSVWIRGTGTVEAALLRRTWG